MPVSSKLLTYDEAAARLGVTVCALKMRIRRGEGPRIVRIGRNTVRIDEQDLDRYIEDRKEGRE